MHETHAECVRLGMSVVAWVHHQHIRTVSRGYTYDTTDCTAASVYSVSLILSGVQLSALCSLPDKHWYQHVRWRGGS